MTEHDLTPFTRGYLECGLWLALDYRTYDAETDQYPESIALNELGYDASDFDEESLARVVEDCKAFEFDQRAMLEAYYDLGRSESDAGHDFYLSRNRHGAGFWDRGLDILGEELTVAAHSWGDQQFYLGYDDEEQEKVFIE